MYAQRGPEKELASQDSLAEGVRDLLFGELRLLHASAAALLPSFRLPALPRETSSAAKDPPLHPVGDRLWDHLDLRKRRKPEGTAVVLK